MPTAEQFQEQVQQHNIWKKIDPSPFYDVYSQDKLGVGGFAKVFRVQRKGRQEAVRPEVLHAGE